MQMLVTLLPLSSEMEQNASRSYWDFDCTDQKLKKIIQNISQRCHKVFDEFGFPQNYVVGSNIAEFKKFADSMLDILVI